MDQIRSFFEYSFFGTQDYEESEESSTVEKSTSNAAVDETIEPSIANSLSTKNYSNNRQQSTKWRICSNLFYSLSSLLVMGGGVLGIYSIFTSCSSICISGDGVLTEYSILVCERALAGVDCSFSVEQCRDQCPFGYEANEYDCPISCTCAAAGVLEGDISFNPNTIASLLADYTLEQDAALSPSISLHKNIWNVQSVENRIRIPYVLSRSIYSSQISRNAINAVFRNLSETTCIDFYPRTDELDFLEFANEFELCRSFVGRIGGRQKISLGRNCLEMGIIVHQLMHALGFYHEHTRNDRDNHITVFENNTVPGSAFNFQRRGLEGQMVSSDLSPYDIQSVTQFDGLDFSLPDFQVLFDVTSREPIIAQRRWLSSGDISEIMQVYCRGFSETFMESGTWSEWLSWSTCSSSCGDGQVVRVRKCVDGAGKELYYGRCPGELHETQLCQRPPCMQGAWGTWSSCSVTCGVGSMIRESCCGSEALYDQRVCSLSPCDMSNYLGQWTTWSNWEACSRSCGAGFQRRSRSCADASGNTLLNSNCYSLFPRAIDFQQCTGSLCNISGRMVSIWSKWSSWSPCSVTCGSGFQVRTRSCNLKPSNNTECDGNHEELNICLVPTTCRLPLSSLKSIWGPWSAWSPCSVSCGTGMQQRERKCFKPMMKILKISSSCLPDQDSINSYQDFQICATESCSDSGVTRKRRNPKSLDQASSCTWYRTCDQLCKAVKRCRTTRSCLSALHDSFRKLSFSYNKNKRFNKWKKYFVCSLCRCTRWRRRSLKFANLARCMNFRKFKKICKSIKRYFNRLSIWSDWSSWTECSRPCGGGMKWRHRFCLHGKSGMKDCIGSWYSRKRCQLNSCRTKYLRGDWESWSNCSDACHGLRTRRRVLCFHGGSCVMSTAAIQPCNVNCNQREFLSFTGIRYTDGGVTLKQVLNRSDEIPRSESHRFRDKHKLTSSRSSRLLKSKLRFRRIRSTASVYRRHDLKAAHTNPCFLIAYGFRPIKSRLNGNIRLFRDKIRFVKTFFNVSREPLEY